ncbi:hypothetical protein JHK87_035226 [Glycine soja]|nr:hypothetical protein JHK87_035226 [Glycine soja]
MAVSAIDGNNGGRRSNTIEAERISVDHFAYLKPSDGGSAATQFLQSLWQIPFSVNLRQRDENLERFYETFHGANISIQEKSLLNSLSGPISGELTVETSVVPNHSIDIRLFRAESILLGEKIVTETSLVQTTQARSQRALALESVLSKH